MELTWLAEEVALLCWVDFAVSALLLAATFDSAFSVFTVLLFKVEFWAVLADFCSVDSLFFTSSDDLTVIEQMHRYYQQLIPC